eukprot:jgi/Mesen1/3829/ME000207S02843
MLKEAFKGAGQEIAAQPTWKDSFAVGTSLGATLLKEVVGMALVVPLDIYLPGRPVRDGRSPVALFVHGGVWSSGDKWQYSPLGKRVAEEGVVAVLIHYSLYPQVSQLVRQPVSQPAPAEYPTGKTQDPAPLKAKPFILEAKPSDLGV